MKTLHKQLLNRSRKRAVKTLVENGMNVKTAFHYINQITDRTILNLNEKR
jgi:hypothetical protein